MARIIAVTCKGALQDHLQRGHRQAGLAQKEVVQTVVIGF